MKWKMTFLVLFLCGIIYGGMKMQAVAGRWLQPYSVDVIRNKVGDSNKSMFTIDLTKDYQNTWWTYQGVETRIRINRYNLADLAKERAKNDRSKD